MYVMGIDVGTQGARALVTDLHGQVAADASTPFAASDLAASRPGYFEQDPRHWREARSPRSVQAVRAFRAGGPRRRGDRGARRSPPPRARSAWWTTRASRWARR